MKTQYVGPFGIGCTLLLIILAISAAVGSITWPYTLNTWLVFFGKTPSVTWWQGALLGFCPYIGQVSIPAALVTWAAMLFLV